MQPRRRKEVKDFTLEVQFLDGAVVVTRHEDGKPVFLLDEAYANHGDDKSAAARRAIVRAVTVIGEHRREH